MLYSTSELQIPKIPTIDVKTFIHQKRRKSSFITWKKYHFICQLVHKIETFPISLVCPLHKIETFGRSKNTQKLHNSVYLLIFWFFYSITDINAIFISIVIFIVIISCLQLEFSLSLIHTQFDIQELTSDGMLETRMKSLLRC